MNWNGNIDSEKPAQWMARKKTFQASGMGIKAQTEVERLKEAPEVWDSREGMSGVEAVGEELCSWCPWKSTGRSFYWTLFGWSAT